MGKPGKPACNCSGAVKVTGGVCEQKIQLSKLCSLYEGVFCITPEFKDKVGSHLEMIAAMNNVGQ